MTPHLYISILRAVAARPRHEQANLRLLLEMICQYVDIYTEKCAGCGRLTFAVGGGARAELPVVRRRAKEENRTIGNGNGNECDSKGNGSDSGRKAQVSAKDAPDSGEVNPHRASGGSPTGGGGTGEGDNGRYAWRAWHEGCLEQGVSGLMTTTLMN